MRTMRVPNKMHPSLVSFVRVILNGCSSLEHSVGFYLADHFLTIGVESVIDDPLDQVKVVIVFKTQMSEPFSDGLKSWTFRMMPKGIIGISSIDDLTQQHQCGIVGKVVLFQDRFEGAFVAVVA